MTERNPENLYMSSTETQNDTITKGISDPSDSQLVSLYYATVLLTFYKVGINIFCT